MKLQKILNRLLEKHPKEKIDLGLDRIKELCKKLDNPQDKIKAISVVGSNGKNSSINAKFAILKEANFNCNVYTSLRPANAHVAPVSPIQISDKLAIEAVKPPVVGEVATTM